MHRLHVSTRLLTVVLLAILAHMVASGASVPVAVTAAIIAGLLIFSLLLTRQGRQLEPPRQEPDASRATARMARRQR
jgi:hypothetical protein